MIFRDDVLNRMRDEYIRQSCLWHEGADAMGIVNPSLREAMAAETADLSQVGRGTWERVLHVFCQRFATGATGSGIDRYVKPANWNYKLPEDIVDPIMGLFHHFSTDPEMEIFPITSGADGQNRRLVGKSRR